MAIGDIINYVDGVVGVWQSFQPAANIEIIITSINDLGQLTDGVNRSISANYGSAGNSGQQKIGITNSVFLNFHGSSVGSGWSGIQIK